MKSSIKCLDWPRRSIVAQKFVNGIEKEFTGIGQPGMLKPRERRHQMRQGNIGKQVMWFKSTSIRVTFKNAIIKIIPNVVKNCLCF